MNATKQPAMIDETITAQFPREIVLSDGTKLTVTPMVASDWKLLREFFDAVPTEERQFLRHDVADPEIVEQWCANLDYQQILPLLVWDGGAIVADGSLHQEPGLWTSHIGKVRVLVREDHRGRGIGTAITKQLIGVAREFKLQKVVAECAPEQEDFVAMLRRLGFGEVARLPDFVCDRSNKLHEMLVLVYDLR